MQLKHNSLKGPIPHQLSGMTMSEILDLSHNKLSEEIPQTLVKLTFLSTFGVSFNQLHGEIPIGASLILFPMKHEHLLFKVLSYQTYFQH